MKQQPSYWKPAGMAQWKRILLVTGTVGFWVVFAGMLLWMTHPPAP